MTDKEQAEQMQERISELCYARLAPLLEKLCDELDPGDTVLRIDKLAIDVGSMSEDELDELLEPRLEKQLRDQIQAQLYEQSLHQTIREVGGILFPEDGLNKGFSASKNMSETAVLEHFLTTGTLPWWKSDLDKKTTATLFKEIFDRNTQMIIETVIRVTTNVQVSRRIVNTVPTEHLIQLHNTLQPEYSALLQRLEKDVMQLRAISEVKDSIHEAHKLVWPTEVEWIKDAHAFGLVAQYPVKQFPVALTKYWVKNTASKVGAKALDIAVVLADAMKQHPTQFESEIAEIMPQVVEELLKQTSTLSDATRPHPKSSSKSKVKERFQNNPLVEFIQPEQQASEEDVVDSPFDERVFEQSVGKDTEASDLIKVEAYEEGDYEMKETLSSIKKMESASKEDEAFDPEEKSIGAQVLEPDSIAAEVVDAAVSSVQEEKSTSGDIEKAEGATDNPTAEVAESVKEVTTDKNVDAPQFGSLQDEVEDKNTEQEETTEEALQPPISKAEQKFKNNPLVEFVRPSKPTIVPEGEVREGPEDSASTTPKDEQKTSQPQDDVASDDVDMNDSDFDSSKKDDEETKVTATTFEGSTEESPSAQSFEDETKAKVSGSEQESKSEPEPELKSKLEDKQKLNAPSKRRAFNPQSPSSYIHPLRAEWKGEESFYRWGDTPRVDEAYITNCGLVLLWVYLPNFFKNLGYLDGKEFVSEEAQFKAVNILQKVVLGVDAEYEEFDLALNKILCGLDVGTAVPIDIEFSAEELEHVGNLCEAAVKNWAVLKNTPVDGFRQAFLQRKGKLEKDGNGWRIHVEPSTPDVLISFLPWSIQIIKLPWVPHLIFTEWKTQF